MNDKDLIAVITKVLTEIIKEEGKQVDFSKKDLYVVLSYEWEDEYLSFFSKCVNPSLYNVHTVIPSGMQAILRCKKLINAGEIISREQIELESLDNYITVFPVLPRDIVAKTALCISDTFETKWIESCLMKGLKVIVRKSGLKGFTGLETQSYINKIKSYYEDIKSYGIEITDDFSAMSKGILQQSPPVIVKESSVIPTTNSKNIITEKDIDHMAPNQQVLLNPGDIITSLAREKAQSRGISIIVSK